MDGLELAKLILESPSGVGTSALREGFFRAAQIKVNIPDEVAKVGECSGADPEVIMKINLLKECENFSNIGWFDFGSWNSLPDDFKVKFTTELDPLVWSGIYFNYAQFLDHKDEVLKLLEPTIVVSLLKVYNSIEFKVVSSHGGYYSHFSVNNMKKVTKYFKDRLIISYSVDKDHNVMSLKGEKYGSSFPT